VRAAFKAHVRPDGSSVWPNISPRQAWWWAVLMAVGCVECPAAWLNRSGCTPSSPWFWPAATLFCYRLMGHSYARGPATEWPGKLRAPQITPTLDVWCWW